LAQGPQPETPRLSGALAVVSEDSEGIVVSGLKLLGTSAVFSDEAWIGSMIPLGPDQINEAVTFAIPINHPGVAIWVRESFELRAPIRSITSSRRNSMRAMASWCSTTCAYHGAGFSAIATSG
jgi:aromatic ring hydroxylase